MSSAGAAPRAAVPTSHARAEASRKNGARSRGPKTAEGKARSAMNALKHGLRAQKYVVLPEEDGAAFGALAAAILAELAPVGVLQTQLARQVAIAAWRLMRADRMEVEVLDFRRGTPPDNVGLALIRDGNGTRSIETLLRYRGAASAELMRALRTLKALQAEQATKPVRPALETAPVPVLMFEPTPAHADTIGPASDQEPPSPSHAGTRSNPRPTDPRHFALAPAHAPEQPPGLTRVQTSAPDPAPAAAARARPSEPEARANSGDPTLPDEGTNPSATPPGNTASSVQPRPEPAPAPGSAAARTQHPIGRAGGGIPTVGQ